MAIGCGASVGNLYYAQPLLSAIAGDLHVGYDEAGLIVTLSQIGYAIGLLALVPLGDLLQRRRLIIRTLMITALALAGAGLAPSLGALAAAILVVGVTSVVAQILVPFAAELAPEGERGRVVGTVMSGLLAGMLLARTVAGLLAQIGTWRVAFLVAAGAMLALAQLLWKELPEVKPSSQLRYGGLMRSIVQIAREDSVIRWRSLFGAIAFACFSVLWTSISFLLSGAPFHYGPAVIGLFGLLGVAGATMATLAGRLADAGLTVAATGSLFALLACSFGLLSLGGSELTPLLAGIVLLDIAVQGIHILNQATIYSRRPESRGRVTTIYMTTYFVGGALGSAAAAAVYASYGWQGVCELGAALSVLGLLSWALQRALAMRRTPALAASRQGDQRAS